MTEDDATQVLLKDAVDTSRRNETTLNRILGGLLLLGALQTGFVAGGTWIFSTVISNTSDIKVLKEQVKSLQDTMNKLKGEK